MNILHVLIQQEQHAILKQNFRETLRAFVTLGAGNSFKIIIIRSRQHCRVLHYHHCLAYSLIKVHLCHEALGQVGIENMRMVISICSKNWRSVEKEIVIFVMTFLNRSIVHFAFKKSMHLIFYSVLEGTPLVHSIYEFKKLSFWGLFWCFLRVPKASWVQIYWFFFSSLILHKLPFSWKLHFLHACTKLLVQV